LRTGRCSGSHAPATGLAVRVAGSAHGEAATQAASAREPITTRTPRSTSRRFRHASPALRPGPASSRSSYRGFLPPACRLADMRVRTPQWRRQTSDGRGAGTDPGQLLRFCNMIRPARGRSSPCRRCGCGPAASETRRAAAVSRLRCGVIRHGSQRVDRRSNSTPLVLFQLRVAPITRPRHVPVREPTFCHGPGSRSEHLCSSACICGSRFLLVSLLSCCTKASRGCRHAPA
jgi:hypothetical protein